MEAVTELAKLLKERENISVQGIGVGKVIGVDPVRIVFNGFILTGNRIVVAKHLVAAYSTTDARVGDHGAHVHTIVEPLAPGESVIIIPSADNGTYFIIDKVG